MNLKVSKIMNKKIIIKGYSYKDVRKFQNNSN